MMRYTQERYGGVRLSVLDGFRDPRLIEICCRGPRGNPSFQPVASSKFANVYRFEYGGRDYYFKQFLLRNRMEPLKALLRGTRAERALRGDRILLERGFSVPLALLIGRGDSTDFTVSQAVMNGLGLNRYFSGSLGNRSAASSARLKKRTADALGREIGRMHSLGIRHGDLRWGNILVEVRDGEPERFFLIDNERTVHLKRMALRDRVKNLVQLNMTRKSVVTRTDRLRFLNAYLDQNPSLKRQKKGLIDRIVAQTRKRQARREPACNGS